MLYGAALAGHPDVVAILLAAGADLESRDTERDATALHVAAKAGNIEAFASLLNISSAEVRNSLIGAKDKEGKMAEDHWPEVKEVGWFKQLKAEL
eukprot:COSAG06_NODE_15276_length_1084_cov_1.139086_1_plen_95_part_00